MLKYKLSEKKDSYFTEKLFKCFATYYDFEKIQNSR